MIKELELELDNNEELLWHQGQGTFHRGYDFELAITNVNACLYVRRFSISPKWIKIPLQDMISVDVSKPSFFQGLPSLLPMYILFFCMLVGSFSIYSTSLSTLRVMGMFVWTGLMIYMAKSIKEMSQGRTHLKITAKNRVIGYTSYADGYKDTHAEDREIILGFIEAIGHLNNQKIQTSIKL